MSNIFCTDFPDPTYVWKELHRRQLHRGHPETQECIDFCNEKRVIPEYKTITHDKLPEVYDKLSGKNDSITRYVLDITKSSMM